MRIHSFVKPESLSEDCVTLSSEESHHLARVLRVEAGQKLTLFDGQGTRAEAVVTDVNKKAVAVRVVARETVPPPAVEITLILALPKPDRFELILQKATELGVRCIRPVTSAHTAVPGGKLEKLFKRGETIILNAAQQCGTAWIPDCQPVEKIGAVLPELGNVDAVFIGSLYDGAMPFKKAFEQLRHIGSLGEVAPPENTASKGRARPPGEPFRAALLIGPEGDFTEEEVQAAIKSGAIPVSFGSQILRTETAAIFGLSVLAYELC